MGCTSVKQVSSVASDEEGRGEGHTKAYSNGYLLSEEYKAKGVEEELRCMGGQDTVNACNQENMEKSKVPQRGTQREGPGPNGTKANIHTSESQQEFFRMLDEKIEKGQDYCSEEEQERT